MAVVGKALFLACSQELYVSYAPPTSKCKQISFVCFFVTFELKHNNQQQMVVSLLP